MSITPEKTKTLIKEFAISAADTGSVDVQCALLTERIKNLTSHLGINKKDTQAKRGMIRLVNRRRKLLKYSESENATGYLELVKKLGIRK